MDVVHARCCGIDIHKKSAVACLIVPGPDGQPSKTVRTFGTMTDDLLALADWLAAEGVSHVALEATGVYWKPVWNLLEASFALILANPQHIKAVPGRKTDGKDAEWIADLLRHGLLRGSFVPDRPQRELRELTRYRTALVRERTREINRVQKTLEGRQREVGRCGQQCAWHLWSSDVARAGSRQHRYGDTRRSGQRQTSGETCGY
jgi:transposase